ncbi:Bifunctional protein GlmU [Candidatus Gugararchaeum adminiculabundum]|nr:Bifunctional protein GlmU [Candidatus Gugararchaeum adminiculabundum]
MGEFSVCERVQVGKGTRIMHHVNIYDCRIGDNCKIACFVEIQRGVVIGNNCKVEAFAFIPSGVEIADDVFIGPHVAFTNDRVPRATGDWEITKTVVKKGASIGANCTVVCGVTIGENALIAAGSVVTRDVPNNALVMGCPGRIKGYICACKNHLDVKSDSKKENRIICSKCKREIRINPK